MIRSFISRKLCSATSSHYDVVVCGNGIVGTSIISSLACSRITSGLKCLLIGKKHDNTNSDLSFPLTTGRTYAISLGSKELLSQINIWKDIEEKCANKVTKMAIWDTYGGKLEFDEDNKSPLCFIVDEKYLTYLLTKKHEEITEHNRNYTTILDKKIVNINQDYNDDKVTISFDTGETVTSHLLVGCDGARSTVRDLLKLETFEYNYKMTALTATLISPEGPHFTAFQKFTPSGIIGILPLASGVSSLVWSANDEFAEELKTYDDSMLLDKLNSILLEAHSTFDIPPLVSQFIMAINPGFIAGRRCVPNFTTTPFKSILEGSRGTFPLHLMNPCQYMLGRVALAGDSAHRVHPMSGQGLNLGLGDAQALIRLINNAILTGSSLKDYPDFLSDYDTDRKKKVIPNMALTTFLKLMYHDYRQYAAPAGAMGMNIINLCKPIKDMLKDTAQW